MKKAILFSIFLISISACSTQKTAEFLIADEEFQTNIYLDQEADDLVKWAVKDLLEDLQMMTGKGFAIQYVDDLDEQKVGIYVGTVGNSIGKNLSAKLAIDLENKWENFIIEQNQKSLCIVGSDVRGTVYGVFELAKMLGVSPWKWWADVVVQQKEIVSVNVPNGKLISGPSVQYRGIFLNDEDWGLQPWAAKTFEPETGDIGPKTYEKIFQLLLRLKANTIWPAMHPSTKAFFKIPGNKEMAEKYQIFVGTSHAEPMLRNNVDEWDKSRYGEFNYFSNSDQVKAYWQERITETKDVKGLVTLGMRGIHDSGMEGDASTEERVDLLETIISDQRQMLQETYQKPIEEIPQVFTLYKEVLELYDAGMKVPDDVTLMWSDDNYGYIRRLGKAEEQNRKGGSGVYYHLSYWGRPHDYLWLSTTQPGLIWYEMTRAYQNGAKKIWIANVGDIKPAEYTTELFLDMAWDVKAISESSINKHLLDWSIREFGEIHAKEITEVMQEYYRLAVLRKPEYMGWSQTEPTTKTRMGAFLADQDNDEVSRRIEAYSNLVSRLEAIQEDIPDHRQDAFFQLVSYPVRAAASMNHKFLFAQQAALEKNPEQKEKLTKRVEAAYQNIINLTEIYNQQISTGKWNGMMSMNPRNLPVFSMPTFHLEENERISIDSENGGKLPKPIAIQAKDYVNSKGSGDYEWKTVEALGYSDQAVTLFPFDNFVFDKEAQPYLEYHFDIKEKGDYNVELRLIPTHANDFDHEVTLEINGKIGKSHSINTRGRSEEWKQNTLQNHAKVIYPISFTESGKQVLKVYVNQTGIVLDQLSVSPNGSPKFYEIEK
ncbi:glycosyl hydrolase 115 family protein [Belliella sp. R4-6]|uniref:Glycosyl hydrolase 115 family protein n=1 Tax=Belliella alkalica TaxID=1730871 RepID=A0ABS9VA68_9BACT|nr:glycosyl hydrolase 115 family protein [Belliella alkalica]MCH7413139.1 glycosyl hydrolase 115 family protein [Belliella alkalica]